MRGSTRVIIGDPGRTHTIDARQTGARMPDKHVLYAKGRLRRVREDARRQLATAGAGTRDCVLMVGARLRIPTPQYEPGIDGARLAAGTRQVLGVVGDSYDPHSEVFKKRDIANLILERRGVSRAEDDAGLRCGLSPRRDVG